MMKIGSRDKKVVISVLGLILLVFLIFWIRHRFIPDPELPERSQFVSVVRPGITTLKDNFTVPGVLGADRTINIIPRVPGTITNIFREEGDAVLEGELLALVDPEVYDLELKAAESAWLLAESSLRRTTRLHESSGASLQQLEEVRTNRDAAFSSYELARLQRSYADIRSPIDGMILIRHADAGGNASKDFPLFTIGDADRLLVKCRIPEKHWDRFLDPASIRVYVTRIGGREADVRDSSIHRVSPGISPEGRSFEVICGLPAEGISWPIGVRVSVEFRFSERTNVWSLPLEVLGSDGRLWWIDPADSRARSLDAMDLYRDSESIAVPEAWADRDFVIDGQHRLSDGQLVESFPGEA